MPCNRTTRRGIPTRRTLRIYVDCGPKWRTMFWLRLETKAALCAPPIQPSQEQRVIKVRLGQNSTIKMAGTASTLGRTRRGKRRRFSGTRLAFCLGQRMEVCNQLHKPNAYTRAVRMSPTELAPQI